MFRFRVSIANNVIFHDKKIFIKIDAKSELWNNKRSNNLLHLFKKNIQIIINALK